MPVKLSRLSPSDFRHPADARAMDQLQDTRGLDTVIRKFYEIGIEDLMKVQYSGSCLRLTRRNFPELIFLLEQSADVLGLSTIPELYVQRSDLLEATTIGADMPMVVLTSECIDKLTPSEITFLIGREVGHILNEHVLYRELGLVFPQLMDALSTVTLGLSGLISTSLRYALFRWRRMSDYSADRAGLLCCQEEEVPFQVMAKQAGLPERKWETFQMPDLYEQARAFDRKMDKAMERLADVFFDYPSWGIARARELREWLATGIYLDLLERG